MKLTDKLAIRQILKMIIGLIVYIIDKCIPNQSKTKKS